MERRLLLRALGALGAGAALRTTAAERRARVGYLCWQDEGTYAETTLAGFRRGLADEGFSEGHNLLLLRRSAEGDPDRLPALARELAAEGVEVFFAPATGMATAAWYADRRTPIVIATVLDPVALQFVESLARPGTRVTGVLTLDSELTAKRVQLLLEALPGTTRLGVVIDERMRSSCKQELNHLEATAKRTSVVLDVASVGSWSDLDATFARFARRGIQAVADTLLSSPLGIERAFGEAARRHRLPSMHQVDLGVRSGGLMSYGPDFGETFRLAGRYVGRILKGARPAEMAMEAPRSFRLVVNLGTARELGITLPPQILVRADELIP